MSKEKIYTARWFNKKIQDTSTEESVKKLASQQWIVLSELIGDQDILIEEPERPNQSELGKKLLWYPKAEIPAEKMPTRGNYASNYPVGAVVHFTAGRSLKGDSDAINTIRGGIANGYCYFCISSTGTVFQSFPLNKWGYHCGKSAWPGLGTSLSNKLVGIEICNAGKLDKNGNAWFGEHYPEDQRRTVGAEYGESGTYHKYTDAQEKSLSELLVWLKLNNPEVFNVNYIVGHHEISPGRKNDPCGSLSVTMPALRDKIKELTK